MKLAWICYHFDEVREPHIVFVEPNRYEYARVVPIVYVEIVD